MQVGVCMYVCVVCVCVCMHACKSVKLVHEVKRAWVCPGILGAATPTWAAEDSAPYSSIPGCCPSIPLPWGETSPSPVGCDVLVLSRGGGGTTYTHSHSHSHTLTHSHGGDSAVWGTLDWLW